MEKRVRSLVKALSWRLIAVVVLGLVSYIFTGSIKESGLITGVYTILQIFVYWVHERIWQRIRWGMRQHPLADVPVDRPLEPEHLREITERLRDLGYM